MTHADYAHFENIKNFRRKIAAATDEKLKATLRGLLADELASRKGTDKLSRPTAQTRPPRRGAPQL